MAKILVFIVLWIGEQNMSLDGCNGFNRVMVDPEDLDMIGFETINKARKVPGVERVTIDWEDGHQEWRYMPELKAWTQTA